MALCGQCCAGEGAGGADTQISVSSNIKLHYFDLIGRGELLRMALRVTGVPFDDVIIEMKDWPKMKYEFPLQRVPVLQVDGRMIPESSAIYRYIARKGGLVPSDPKLAAIGDAIVCKVEEMTGDLTSFILASPTEKENVAREIVQRKIMPSLTQLDSYIGSGLRNGFCVGGSFSFADLAVYAFVVNLKRSGFPLDLRRLTEERFPNVHQVVDATESTPAVAQWSHDVFVSGA